MKILRTLGLLSNTQNITGTGYSISAEIHLEKNLKKMVLKLMSYTQMLLVKPSLLNQKKLLLLQRNYKEKQTHNANSGGLLTGRR